MLPYSTIIAGVLAVALSASTYLYIEETKAHATTVEKLVQSNEALTRYVDALNQMGEAQSKVSAEKAEIVLKFKETTRELLNLQNREATVLAKKGLVELKINKAYKEQQEIYACISGDTNLCH